MVEGAIIRPHATVDHFAIVRPGVIIGEWAYVSPFTDVKEHVPPFAHVGQTGSIGLNRFALREFSNEEAAAIRDAFRCLTNGETVPGEITHLASVQLLINFFKEYCE